MFNKLPPLHTHTQRHTLEILLVWFHKNKVNIAIKQVQYKFSGFPQ